MKYNVITIIRARMNSSRLPRKMLLPLIDGRPALELMLERVSRSKNRGRIVVATTTNPDDDAIVDLCEEHLYDCFRGSEEDVLDRCYQAALRNLPLDAVITLTGDCVLIDSKIIDESIDLFLKGDFDYVANDNIPTTYPDGLDVEIVSFNALQTMWKNATTKAEKEHITFYIQKHRDQFKTFNFQYKEDLSDKGWCLDTPQDYEFIKKVYAELYHEKPDFGMEDILDLLERKPELEEINSGIGRNIWRDTSAKEDGIKKKSLTWREK